METIQKKAEKKDVLVFGYSSLDDNRVIEFEIMGQTGERSYEDRSVYFAMRSMDTNPELVIDIDEPALVGAEDTPEPVSTVRSSDVGFNMWFQGEEAIEFGMKLIEHGKFALESNMINHQRIHMETCYKRFLAEERIEEVQFEMIDDSPANYGSGFHTFRITPIWNEGMAPQYQEDFSYEKVIYWSPFEADYADQLDYYTGGLSYSFVGYDHDKAVRDFNESCRLMSGDF